MSRMRTVAVFLLACLIGAVLVSIANTHVMLQALAGIGADIPTGVRIDAIRQDLSGFAPTLFVVMFAAFSIAFPLAGLMAHLMGRGWRLIGFTLAGGLAVAAAMMAITALFGLLVGATATPVASSRELTGLLTLSLGGAAAGFLFATLKPAGWR